MKPKTKQELRIAIESLPYAKSLIVGSDTERQMAMNTKDEIEALDRDIDAIEKRIIARSEAFTLEDRKDQKIYKAMCFERDKLCRKRIEELDKERAQ